jgi:hypothetical protein
LAQFDVNSAIAWLTVNTALDANCSLVCLKYITCCTGNRLLLTAATAS